LEKTPRPANGILDVHGSIPISSTILDLYLASTYTDPALRNGTRDGEFPEPWGRAGGSSHYDQAGG